MKFIKKIGDGEVTVQDNQVIENTSKTADNWASEFSQQHNTVNKKCVMWSNVSSLIWEVRAKKTYMF